MARTAPSSLTYPVSTSGFRFKTQFEYAYGILKKIKNFDSPSIVYWELNAHDERGQPIDEQLGNGARIISGFDSLTGLMLYRQTGTTAPFTNRQNLSFEWDLNGNLKKRIDGNQSNLTEEFFYDALNRLDYSQLNGVTNLDLTLDAIGNVTAKTSATDPTENIGTYSYHATKKHAVVSTSNGWSFGYDANGNMTSHRGNTVSWYSYNLPATITGNSQSSQFWYGPNRNRWKQVASYPSGTETTIYVGGILEKVTVPAGTAYRHYIGAGSAQVVYARWSTGSESTKYVTTDQLNSSTVVMDGAGASLVNLSFASFGARRGSAWNGTPSSGDWTQINNATRHGYTGHEHLDNIGVIHMNGRVFDPALGRFLSADPFMPGSLGSQAPNRYAYVGNQPLSLADPSGFWPRNGNAMKAWKNGSQDSIAPWEEAAFMNAQLAWHQMFPSGGMVGGVPMMQTATGRQMAQARRDYGHVSATSLLPQFSFRTQYSIYVNEPGFDVTEPILQVFGNTNFGHPTSFGIEGQWSTTFQQRPNGNSPGQPPNGPTPSPAQPPAAEPIATACTFSDMFHNGNAYPISSEFGPRVHPITGTLKDHKGIDIAAPQRTMWLSPIAGSVVFSKMSGIGGLTLVVQGTGDFSSFRIGGQHLSALFQITGTDVEPGDPLGRTGGELGRFGSGGSTGPHLHFYVRQNGNMIDPAPCYQR